MRGGGNIFEKVLDSGKKSMREHCSGLFQAPTFAAWQENEDGPKEEKAEGGASIHEQWEQ